MWKGKNRVCEEIPVGDRLEIIIEQMKTERRRHAGVTRNAMRKAETTIKRREERVTCWPV